MEAEVGWGRGRVKGGCSREKEWRVQTVSVFKELQVEYRRRRRSDQWVTLTKGSVSRSIEGWCGMVWGLGRHIRGSLQKSGTPKAI